MATILELQKINEFVRSLDTLSQITGAVVYGIDSQGKSVKIACSTLTDTSTLETRINTVDARSLTNSGLIAALQTAVQGKADADHTHEITDIEDLQDELDGKAAAVHNHTIANVEGLVDELSNKANAVHTHEITDIEDLQDALDEKSDVGHLHNIEDVQGLQNELDGKAAAVHTHTIPEIAQLQTQIQEINSEVSELNTDVNEITIAAGMQQVEDLTTYTAAAGKVVQYVGETTSDYKHGYIYQYNQVGDPVEVPAGYWYRNLANGHILRLTNTSIGNKQSQISTATLDGLTYYIIGGLNEAFHSETEVDWDTIIQEAVVGKMLIPCSNGSYYKVSELVGESSQASNGWFWNFRSMVLDNGVEITWQDIDRGVIILNINKIFEDPSDVGTIYYGNNYGGELCPIISKVHIDNDNSQFKLIPTEPIGYIFTGSEHYEATATTVTTMQWQQTLVQPDSRIYFDETNSKIQIKDEFGNVKSEISASAFLKDGMIQSVELVTVQEQGVSVEVPYLKFVFNTDAGQQPIRLSLHDISATTSGVLKQVADLETYESEAQYGEIVQYTGVTDEFTNGYIYKFGRSVTAYSKITYTTAEIDQEAPQSPQTLLYPRAWAYGVFKGSMNFDYGIPNSITDVDVGTIIYDFQDASKNTVSSFTVDSEDTNLVNCLTTNGKTFNLDLSTQFSIGVYTDLNGVYFTTPNTNTTDTTRKGFYCINPNDPDGDIANGNTLYSLILDGCTETELDQPLVIRSAWERINVQPQTDTSTIETNIAALQTSKANEVTSFTEAATRANIASGDTVTTILGKIKKWFTDLKAVAFSGSYDDLSNKPLSVENSKVKYTLSDGTTKLTLAQEGDLKAVAFSGSYTDLTNRPFKDFTLTAPGTAVTAGMWMGLIKWSRTDINERVEIFGEWTTGTLGMITIEVKGRPVASMGYSISYSTPAMDKSYTLAVGVKDEEVYLIFKYNQSNYKSGASIRLTGFRNNYAENLNFAIFTEYSSLTFVKTIEVSKS